MANPTQLSAQSTEQPNLLRRVWAGTHYIWQREKVAEFMEWLRTTQHIKGPNPNWGSKKSMADATSIWSHFDECADTTTGEPGLCCRSCHQLFFHPNICRYGNSVLGRHMRSCCLSAQAQSDSGQQSLVNMVVKVCHNKRNKAYSYLHVTESEECL
jgi:hypothetical protein